MKKLYNLFFYIPKHGQATRQTLAGHMAVSVLTIAVCLLTLSSTTLAWFTEQAVAVATIHSAEHWTRSTAENCTLLDAAAVLSEGNSGNVAVFLCDKSEEDMHLLSLTSEGTATGGYCVITIYDEENTAVYTTETIPLGDTFHLNIQAAEGTYIIIETLWGQPDDGVETIDSGFNISFSRSEEEPTEEITEETTEETTVEITAETTVETTQETTEATTEPATQPSAEPETEPTEVPETETTTEPTEVPVTEAATEPATEVTTEPATEPSQAPTDSTLPSDATEPT